MADFRPAICCGLYSPVGKSVRPLWALWRFRHARWELVMIVIVGCIVVVGCVLGGFTMAGGHVGALIHPSEVVTIGGAALGSLIVMSPKKVLIGIAKAMLGTLKGSPFNKKAYIELFSAMYELFRISRINGMLALEPHLNNPHDSTVFHKYPGLAKNHHVMDFICGLLTPVMDGSINPDKMPKLAEAEIRTIEEDHHALVNVIGKTADSLPGFGIVAAVLGIVITMAHIDGPVEEIGHKVGAALVGTFLGILASYGFFAPIAVNIEFQGATELQFFRTIASVIQGFVDDLPPKTCIERAVRGLPHDMRPSAAELEELFKNVEKG
jgi:chemotaxis protein MotA